MNEKFISKVNGFLIIADDIFITGDAKKPFNILARIFKNVKYPSIQQVCKQQYTFAV